MLGLIMFVVCLLVLLLGFPVAFTFAGVAFIFAIFSPDGIGLFALMPYRIMSIMQNTILIAVPLFIFMGIMLQKTNLANKLLSSMAELFGNMRGGIAVSTIIIGSLLAASTGVVGATMAVMGLVTLPTMLKHKINNQFACGVICASGTLGQIVPPSIVLIILADVLNLPVGDLFNAAIIPAVVLIFAYIIFAIIYSYYTKIEVITNKNKPQYLQLIINIVPVIILITIVLGSIFSGIATPTESAAVGAVGSIMLAALYGKLNIKNIKEATLDTARTTAMIFTILIGATAFSMVFSYTGGDELLFNIIHSMPNKEWGFIILSMLLILILGFFIDFIEISLIIVPILYPIAHSLGIDMQWFAILIAMNLQTSFLTPPFGFSLFYLRGVAPPSIKTIDIYKGVLPFIAIQVLVLISIIVIPSMYGFKGFI